MYLKLKDKSSIPAVNFLVIGTLSHLSFTIADLKKEMVVLENSLKPSKNQLNKENGRFEG